MEIRYTNNISVKDYCMLRASIGALPIIPEQAEAGLRGSAFIVTALDGEKVIGTARLIWDGGYCAFIKNVMVLPEYQGKGIGTELMLQIIDYVKKQLKPGYGISIELTSSVGKEAFYEKIGFKAKKKEVQGCGMGIYIKHS